MILFNVTEAFWLHLMKLNQSQDIKFFLSGGMKIPVSKLRYTDVQKALIESAAEKKYIKMNKAPCGYGALFVKREFLSTALAV